MTVEVRLTETRIFCPSAELTCRGLGRNVLGCLELSWGKEAMYGLTTVANENAGRKRKRDVEMKRLAKRR